MADKPEQDYRMMIEFFESPIIDTRACERSPPTNKR